MSKRRNRYAQLIEAIFLAHFEPGATELDFEREEIERTAKQLNIKLPKNLGDLIYSFRHRADLPDAIVSRAPPGQRWVIRGAGRGKYRFALTDQGHVTPNNLLMEIKVPDATPGIISTYALSDEQALLARLRYNRLIDIFTGVACYSLQNHLRTTVAGLGQVETDEIYIGVDSWGAHHVFPVQAKTSRDRSGVVQIEQDFAVCAEKFPDLICRPIAAQFMRDDLIALFAFVQQDDGSVRVSIEKHYRLVSPAEISPDDLVAYRANLPT